MKLMRGHDAAAIRAWAQAKGKPVGSVARFSQGNVAARQPVGARTEVGSALIGRAQTRRQFARSRFHCSRRVLRLTAAWATTDAPESATRPAVSPARRSLSATSATMYSFCRCAEMAPRLTAASHIEGLHWVPAASGYRAGFRAPLPCGRGGVGATSSTGAPETMARGAPRRTPAGCTEMREVQHEGPASSGHARRPPRLPRSGGLSGPKPAPTTPAGQRSSRG